ncbi:MAG: tetratricopeptide repeat protein [Tepidisphaerales bacterium]
MADTQPPKPDLKDLDLATGVDKIPEWWNKHGNKVLIGITVLALAYAAYTFRRNSIETARLTAEANLTAARELIADLQLQPFDRLQPEQYLQRRRDILRDTSQALADVIARAPDPAYVAQALLLQGDLNYLIGMMPELEAATTRPELKLERSPEQLFAAAKASYQAVLNRFPQRLADVASARLGLGAVAENAGDFDTAKAHYEALRDNDRFPPNARQVAEARLRVLPQLAAPMLVRQADAPPPATPSTPSLLDLPLPMPAGEPPSSIPDFGLPGLPPLPPVTPPAPSSPATRP